MTITSSSSGRRDIFLITYVQKTQLKLVFGVCCCVTVDVVVVLFFLLYGEEIIYVNKTYLFSIHYTSLTLLITLPTLSIN